MRHLKEWVNEHYSELETLTDNDEIIKKCMIETLQEPWAAINDEFLKVGSVNKEENRCCYWDRWLIY